MTPKISAIIVVLNGAKTAVDAINSVLIRTFRNFEKIMIDGGSTDGTIAPSTVSSLPTYENLKCARKTRIYVIIH